MIQNRVIIGITGGIGTGKSTVSNYLKDKGYELIDFDIISRTLYTRGKKVYNDIVKIFGKEILNSEEEIDRKKLGEIVFSDKIKMDMLNSIVHGAIYDEAKSMIDKSNEKIIFLDIPLLYETSEYLKKYDIILSDVWLVYCDEMMQIKRVMERDKIDYMQSRKKVDSQMKMQIKLHKKNKVIYNDRDKKHTFNQVDKLLKDL